MKKSLFKVFILIACIFSFFIGALKVNAANILEIVQNTGGVKPFGSNDGYVEKSIIDSDLEKGEITIRLLVNNARSTEIMFVLDNSTEIGAMSGLKSSINSSLKTLVSDLHDNDNLKTGVMQMHPYGDTTTVAPSGGVISSLSDSETITNAGADTYLSTAAADGQDFIEVLTAASNAFDEETNNKIIVLLTTGIDQTHITEYKNALSEIGSDATIASIVIDNEDLYIEELFGTESTPTTGVYYNIDSTDLDTTLNSLLKTYITNLLPKDKYNIVIEDLFTDNILNNFTITYLEDPTVGVVEEFDTENKMFTWNVDDLLNNVSASFTYKLSLKDAFDTSLEDVILNTNNKLNITYTDISYENQSLVYDVNPTIKILTSLTNPKTGLYDYFIPASLIFCVSVLIISIIKRKEVFANI